ncbi:MAG: hypothetical protein IT454_01235 [Planctomycetes bacterium]|nr:hypothetical protein [Planctomycetota bacterium]
MLLTLAFSMLVPAQQPAPTVPARSPAPQVALAGRQGARDSTPYARSLEESGRGNVRAEELESSAGRLTASGTIGGLQVRTLSGGPGSGSQALLGAGGSVDPLPTLYEVTIPVAAASEAFLFQETAAAGPRPLLVVFHKYGVGHYDALAHTSFFQEARRRGWYCLAPFGGGQRHFSNLRSQQHTEAALAWARSNFAVDPTRVYAVGFSMGGGAAMNFAARHLDPRETMFAAVFNESGILSHEDTYPQLEPAIVALYDSFFGFGGSAQPFPMQRSSVFSFDPLSLAVDLDTDLGRNLIHLGTHSTRTTGDVPYLITQNELFRAHLLARGASPTRHVLSVINYPGHSWDAVSERAVCDWLRTFKLSLPDAAETLADRDARYFHFDIHQDVSGSFTPFRWSVDSGLNHVQVLDTANLASVAIDLASAGLSASAALSIEVGTADGLPDQVQIQGYSSAPSFVLRDGILSTAWSFDAPNARVLLAESDGALHTWVVNP